MTCVDSVGPKRISKQLEFWLLNSSTEGIIVFMFFLFFSGFGFFNLCSMLFASFQVLHSGKPSKVFKQISLCKLGQKNRILLQSRKHVHSNMITLHVLLILVLHIYPGPLKNKLRGETHSQKKTHINSTKKKKHP